MQTFNTTKTINTVLVFKMHFTNEYTQYLALTVNWEITLMSIFELTIVIIYIT